jgi:hypothetical protein
LKCAECGSERTRKVRKSIPQVVGFKDTVWANGSIQREPVIREIVFVFGVCPNGHAYDLPE